MKKSDPTSAQPLDESELATQMGESPMDTEEGEDETSEPWVWTPERVLEWNAYYDLYVVALVLFLVFVASATQISSPTFWTYLQAGKLTVNSGGPILKEPFTYPRLNEAWINVSWLFEWMIYQVYALVGSVGMASPDQYGVGVLVGIHALIRVLTAAVLLSIRHRGPGLWWTAVTTALALGVVVQPMGISLGGIAARGSVLPETWGLFFVGIELLVLYWAYNRGRRKAVFGLVPLFLIWANFDETFGVGLILLLVTVLGEMLQGRRVVKSASPGTNAAIQGGPTGSQALITFGVCVAVTMVNPSHVKTLLAAMQPLLEVIRPSSEARTVDQLSILGSKSREFFGTLYPQVLGYYCLLIGLGLGSFVLNRARFRLSRFLVFLTASTLWALVYRFQDVFAVVWATTLALNGQEWYQAAFGNEGRLGVRWRVWSVGGRLVTLSLVTLAVLKGMTGYGNQYLDPTFGFGYDADEFAFEAADYLKAAPIEGRVINLKLAQGDALNWRAHPTRKPFLDSRRIYENGPFLDELDRLRSALAGDKPEEWRPILDKYEASVVMVDLQNVTQSRLSQALNESSDWIMFYDDGDVMLFGRTDASPTDLAFFEKSQLDANTMAFLTEHPVRSFNRPPSPIGMIDRVFQARSLVPTQPRVKAAQRWLARDLVAEPNGTLAPGLAGCLLAIQETRNALASKPDDTDAYYIQSLAYRRLAELESRLLTEAGELNADSGLPLPLRIRLQQRMTALNYAIQTAPRPPRTEYARETLRNMYFELSGIYQSLGYLDIARDALADAIELTNPEELDESAQQTLDALTEEMELVRAELEQADLEGQIDPIQLAVGALQRGAVNLAIQRLEDAEAANLSPGAVKWRLVDLFCDIGQPDRALPFLDSIGDDPYLSTGPGTTAFRQGRVYFLLGDYSTAADLWSEIAIPQLSNVRSQSTLQSTTSLLRGDPIGAVRLASDVPNQVLQQAEWEYMLGVAMLEGGLPQQAGEHFQNALKLEPELSGRAVAAEYVRRIGLEVPSKPEKDESESSGPEAGKPVDEQPASEESTSSEPNAAEAESGEPGVKDALEAA